jgi:hypothetical protein
MTRAEEDALLSDLAEVDRHIRFWSYSEYRHAMNLPYLAQLLRHALQIVEGEKP